jgi:hypothetical protein
MPMSLSIVDFSGALIATNNHHPSSTTTSAALAKQLPFGTASTIYRLPILKQSGKHAQKWVMDACDQM